MSNPVGELRKKKDKSGVEQSFLDFVDDKNLYIEEQNKLWEFWQRGGAPFVKEHDYTGRASYKFGKFERGGLIEDNMAKDIIHEDIPDALNLYSTNWLANSNPITDFLAEISHGIQYDRKEGESISDWTERYSSQSAMGRHEYDSFGDEDRYGRKKIHYPETLLGFIKENIWKEEKFEFPVMGENKSDESNLKYIKKWEEYDKETGLGVEGSEPTREFEAHRVIEPKLSKELKDVRKEIFRKRRSSLGY